MSNTQSIHGLMSGTAFTLTIEGQEGVSGVTPAPAGDLDFTIETWPENPLIGEAVQVRAINVTGLGPGEDQFRDYFVDMEFGDPGSKYLVGKGGYSDDANYSVGRSSAHVYETAGAKTISVSYRQFGRETLTKSVTVNVVDPDTVVWDKEVYADFGEVSGTPDFSWAPPAGGNVIHCSSFGQMRNIMLYADNKKNRWVFKDTETFTNAKESNGAKGGAVYILGYNALHYLVGSGGISGGKPLFRNGNASETGGSFFTISSHHNRVVIANVAADGGYDPVTGVVAREGLGTWNLISTNSGDPDTTIPTLNSGVSIWRTTATGCDAMLGGGGGGASPNNAVTRQRVVDCAIKDWSNFGLGTFGRTVDYCVIGCSLKQNPLALLTPNKPTPPTSAHHGPIRLQMFRDVAIENNDLANASGWSGLGTGVFIQTLIRLHVPGIQPQDQPAYQDPNEYIGRTASIHRNIGHGSSFASLASMNVGGGRNWTAPKAYVVSHNTHHTGRQAFTSMFSADVANVYAMFNVNYRANLKDIEGDHNYGFSIEGSEGNGAEDSARIGKLFLAHNTIIGDRSAESSGNSGFELLVWDYQVNQYTSAAKDSWEANADIQIENNLISAPRHTNGTRWPNNFSRSDPFKPTSLASPGGNPGFAYDAAMKPIGATIPDGAYSTVAASNTAPPAPVNTRPPVIAENAKWPNHYQVVDFGDWQNMEPNDFYFFEWTWYLNGSAPMVPIPNKPLRDASKQTTLAAGSGMAGGTITCKLTATNFSGERVTVMSGNSIQRVAPA